MGTSISWVFTLAARDASERALVFPASGCSAPSLRTSNGSVSGSVLAAFVLEPRGRRLPFFAIFQGGASKCSHAKRGAGIGVPTTLSWRIAVNNMPEDKRNGCGNARAHTTQHDTCDTIKPHAVLATMAHNSSPTRLGKHSRSRRPNLRACVCRHLFLWPFRAAVLGGAVLTRSGAVGVSRGEPSVLTLWPS